MFAGILVDVSGSMEQSLTVDDFKSDKAQLYINRAHAVFRTLFKIIKQKNDDNDKWFALAFGLSDVKHEHCDLIDLFEQFSLPFDKEEYCREMLSIYVSNVDKYIVSKKKLIMV